LKQTRLFLQSNIGKLLENEGSLVPERKKQKNGERDSEREQARGMRTYHALISVHICVSMYLILEM